LYTRYLSTCTARFKRFDAKIEARFVNDEDRLANASEMTYIASGGALNSTHSLAIETTTHF